MKNTKLQKVKPKKYLIYGIFNFQTKSLIYIDFNIENVEFEFDVRDYDDENYGIVEFEVLIVI